METSLNCTKHNQPVLFKNRSYNQGVAIYKRRLFGLSTFPSVVAFTLSLWIRSRGVLAIQMTNHS